MRALCLSWKSCQVGAFLGEVGDSCFFLFCFFFVHMWLTECLPGKYGSGCGLDCMCQHNGTCDRFTGCCQCPEGYYGRSCEHSKNPTAARVAWFPVVTQCGVAEQLGGGSVKVLGVYQITRLLPGIVTRIPLTLGCCW